MKHATTIAITFGIIIIVLIILYTSAFIGSKKADIRHTDTITELQSEIDSVTGLLETSKGTIDTIRESINESSERIGKINIGIGSAIDAIDASIRITEELFDLIDAIEKAVSP